MIFWGREHLIKYENFYTVLQISHLVLSFLHPAFGSRAQGAATGSVTKTLHITTNLLLLHRGQAVPGTALAMTTLLWGMGDAPPALPDVCPVPGTAGRRQTCLAQVWQNCLLFWHDLKLGVVSELGVNSWSFVSKAQHSPGQGRDLAELISHCLLSNHWGMVLEDLVFFGLVEGN